MLTDKCHFQTKSVLIKNAGQEIITRLTACFARVCICFGSISNGGLYMEEYGEQHIRVEYFREKVTRRLAAKGKQLWACH